MNTLFNGKFATVTVLTISLLEFANHFISITCTLNGRKVMTCILKKPQKGEDLTFLTFLNHKWLASVQ